MHRTLNWTLSNVEIFPYRLCYIETVFPLVYGDNLLRLFHALVTHAGNADFPLACFEIRRSYEAEIKCVYAHFS